MFEIQNVQAQGPRLNPRASKPVLAPNRFVQILHLFHGEQTDAFQHELRYFIPLLKLDFVVRVIVEQHFHFTSVIAVDHASVYNQSRFKRNAGPWRNAAVKLWWNRHGNARFNQAARVRRQHRFVQRIQIEAGCVRAAARW